MSIGSAIGKLFAAIWKAIMKIVNAIIDFIKKYWFIILLVAAIWFAPAVAAWLSSVGAPGWLTTAFSWAGTNLTPYVTSAGEWLASGAKSLVTEAGTSWSTLTLGQKAGLVYGTVALLAPEETAAFTADAIETIGDATGTFLGGAIAGVGSLLTSNPLLFVGALALGWYIFFGSEDKERIEVVSQPQPTS